MAGPRLYGAFPRAGYGSEAVSLAGLKGADRIELLYEALQASA